jgi:lysophospholipase L1-like esterase
MKHHKNILREQEEPKKLRVLFLGDSQTAMSSISYAYKFIRKGVVDGNVVAKGGANTSQILNMMRNAIDDSYDVVCILAGSNDAWRDTANFSARNLTAMYNLAHQHGALVIAITNPTKRHTKDPSKYPGADVIAEWIRTQNVSDFVVDAHLLTQDRSNFSGDRIHFNQRGQSVIYANVNEILSQLAAKNTGKNSEIRKTQAKLQRLGYDLGQESKLGVSGPKTKKAVEDLHGKQQKAGAESSWSDKAYSYVAGLLSTPMAQGILGSLGLAGLFGAATTKSTTKQEPARTPSSANVPKSTMGVYIVDFFKKKGLTTTQSAGIAGNLKLESGFNLKAVGDNGTSFGLAQWHNERWTNLKSWCTKNGYDPYSADGQLEYLWYELNHSERNALNKLKQQNDAATAAYIFAKHFERPSEISKSRLKFAQEIYDEATENVLNRIV